MFKRILTVCIGNICRSPTAEYVLKAHLPADVIVTSAGISALAGKPADPMAQALMLEHGIDGSAHLARQLTSRMLREADLVLGMEKAHVAEMIRMAPEASGKIFLLDKWTGGRDIADPYRQQREAFEHVYLRIEEAVEGWRKYL
ncbi:low molecular weight phosphotyrosine protein phosphatase [Bacillus sp. NP157]|nr:low molecular weight phosphotyrosine protein phosphatase [Bacillus sp. NP157]